MPIRAWSLCSLLFLLWPASAGAQAPPPCDPEGVPPGERAPLRRDVLGGSLRSCAFSEPVSARQQCENVAAPPCHVDPNARQPLFVVQWMRAGATVSLAGPTPFMTRWPSVRASARGPYRVFEVTLTTEHYGGARTTYVMVLSQDRVVLDELVQECSNSGARWDCGPRARLTWVDAHTLRLRTRAGARTVDLRALTPVAADVGRGNHRLAPPRAHDPAHSSTPWAPRRTHV